MGTNLHLQKAIVNDEILIVEPIATLKPDALARATARRHGGRRVTWTGTLSGFGHRTLNGKVRPHVCLTDVTDDDGVPVFSRVWLLLGTGLQALAPETGDRITFTADVESQLDGTYRLVRPTRFRHVERSS